MSVDQITAAGRLDGLITLAQSTGDLRPERVEVAPPPYDDGDAVFSLAYGLSTFAEVGITIEGKYEVALRAYDRSVGVIAEREIGAATSPFTALRLLRDAEILATQWDDA